jgi:hypothetical protein
VDPGIREAVQRLNEAGFHTSDSGDGVSKPADWYLSGEAIPMPHVAGPLHVMVSTLATELAASAASVVAVLGPEWTCEVTYSSADKVWMFFASTPLAAPTVTPMRRAK